MFQDPDESGFRNPEGSPDFIPTSRDGAGKFGMTRKTDSEAGNVIPEIHSGQAPEINSGQAPEINSGQAPEINSGQALNLFQDQNDKEK